MTIKELRRKIDDLFLLTSPQLGTPEDRHKLRMATVLILDKLQDLEELVKQERRK